MVTPRKQGLGIGVALAACASLVGVVSCGDSFGNDCRSTRTCGAEGGGPSAQAGSDGEGGADEGDAGGSSTPNAGQGGAGIPADDGPVVVSTSPEADSVDAELDTEVAITFSEPLDPATVTADSVQILDGDTVVEGSLDYADAVITFTPAEDFALLADYTIKVTTDVTDVEGIGLSEDFAATFETRDGTWHTVEVASGTLDDARPSNLPITAAGDALVAWSTRSVGDHCSTTFRWFNRGKKTDAPPLLFSASSTAECLAATAAAHADGLAAVAFGTYAGVADELLNYEFRDGKWAAMPTQNGGANALAISPSGALFNFFPTETGMAMVTGDGKGSWLPSAPDIALGTRLWTLPEVAFNAADEGFALWMAAEVLGEDSYGPDRILAARYSAASGSWLNAVTLPGSLAPKRDSAHRRGSPSIAVDPDGGAMALWVERETKTLKMNRYTAGDGWSDAVTISDNLVVDDLGGPAGLVYDGDTYVAAWTAEANNEFHLYTARFDMKASAWVAPELFDEAAVLQARPGLGVDGHGNLMMTCVAPTGAGPSLFYARYHAELGAWTEAQPVPDGAVGQSRSAVGVSPLGVNAKGLAALRWGNAPGVNEPSTLYYASFH